MPTMQGLNEKDIVMQIQPLEIYKNFRLEDMLESYGQLRWIRTYNNMNKFELRTIFDKQLFDTLTAGTGLTDASGYFDSSRVDTIIYKSDVQEACIVEDINVYTNVFGLREMVVRGSGVEKLLDRRRTTLTQTDIISNIVTGILYNNFTATIDPLRRMYELLLGTVNITNNPMVTVDYQTMTSCFTIISDLLQANNIGFRVRMDTKQKKYIFELYEGKYDPYVVYDRNFNNISEEDWYFLSRDYSNVVYIDDTPIGSGYGINRREYSASAVKDESVYTTGDRILRERERVRSANVQIDETNKTFYYLKDWNLGDIITFVSEDLNTQIQQSVLEVHEFYEAGKVKIDVIFGDYIPIRGW